jgi:hypothetical protein
MESRRPEGCNQYEGGGVRIVDPALFPVNVSCYELPMMERLV